MRRYFQALFLFISKIKILDLLLILISATIGITICNYLSLPIDWLNSYRSILSLIFFKISADLISALQDWKEPAEFVDNKMIAQTGDDKQMLIRGLTMIIVAFLSVSMIPYFQIIVSDGSSFLPIILIAIINLSLLVFIHKSYLFINSVLDEFIFSIHMSFSIPLMIIGFSIDKIPSFFGLVFFPLFLFFLTSKLIDKIRIMSEEKTGINSFKISIPNLLMTHNILIASGYLMWIIMGFLGLDAKIWICPIFTLPIGIFSFLLTGRILNGRSKNIIFSYLISYLCSLSVFSSFVFALMRI